MNDNQRAEYKRLELLKKENRDVIKRKQNARTKIDKEIKELQRANENITDKQMNLINQKLF
ncbi:MAG: hypothetical protein ACRCXT_10125 [Paraclostridium sp.]